MLGGDEEALEGASHPHGHVGAAWIFGRLEAIPPHINKGVGDLGWVIKFRVSKPQPPPPIDPQFEYVLEELPRDAGSGLYHLAVSHPPPLAGVLVVAPLEGDGAIRAHLHAMQIVLLLGVRSTGVHANVVRFAGVRSDPPGECCLGTGGPPLCKAPCRKRGLACEGSACTAPSEAEM